MRTTKTTTRPAVATKSSSKVAVGILVGFLGLASVAAAAVGVTAQRDNKDMLVLTAYNAQPLTAAATAKKVSFSMVKSASDVAKPLPIIVGKTEPVVLLQFDVMNAHESDVELGTLSFTSRVQKLGVATTKGVKTPLCHMKDLTLLTSTGEVVGQKVAAANVDDSFTFSNLSFTVPKGEPKTLVLQATPPATDQLGQAHGCEFIIGLDPGKVKAVDTASAEKIAASGKLVKSAKHTVFAAFPSVVLASGSPAGAATKGEDMVIAKFLVTNTENPSGQSLTLLNFPVKISTNIKVAATAPREVKIYKDTVEESNFLYAGVTKASNWKKGQFVVNALLANALVVEGGQSHTIIVIMDTVDAQAGNVLTASLDSSKFLWKGPSGVAGKDTLKGIPGMASINANTLLY